MNAGIALLVAAGRPVVGTAVVLGQMVLTLWRAMRALVRGRVGLRSVVEQVQVCGLTCLPVTVLASVCVGCIVAVQGMGYVRRYSAPEAFGWAAYFSAAREVGPLLMGLTLSARLGALHAAQLAALRVTDRVDAMKALGVDTVGLWVAPRILAMPVAAVLLMAWSNAVSLVSATLFAWAFGGVTPWMTWASVARYALWSDFTLGLWKVAAYGLCSGITATAVGDAARGGADAVGHAVMRAAVVSVLAIVVLNHALTVGLAR